MSLPKPARAGTDHADGAVAPSVGLTAPSPQQLAGQAMEQMATDARHLAQSNLEAVREATQDLKLYAHKAGLDARLYVQRKPLTSVALAVTAGALMMAVFSLIRRR